MYVVPDSRLEEFIAEDVPYGDLTTHVLGIGEAPGRIKFITRAAGMACAVEEAARIMEMCGARVTWKADSGLWMSPQDVLLTAEGPAEALHRGWKVCLNLLDHCSAVATKTAAFVDRVKAINPEVEVLTTRKSMPGTKELMTKAIMCGGAYPHRLGLSETVLVFDNHTVFTGGFEGFLAQVPQLKRSCIEKRLFAEVSADQALQALQAGVDCLQLEKTDPTRLTELVRTLRSYNPAVTIVAAGGITLENCEAYAATGVDGLVTTCLFTAKPLDMTAKMELLA